MIDKQNIHSSLHSLVLVGNKIQAETYQWFQQQQDANNSTIILPDDLTLSAENIDDIEFLKSMGR